MFVYLYIAMERGDATYLRFLWRPLTKQNKTKQNKKQHTFAEMAAVINPAVLHLPKDNSFSYELEMHDILGTQINEIQYIQ